MAEEGNKISRKKTFCPLLSITGDKLEPCLGEGCVWYDNGCVITEISMHLGEIANVLEVRNAKP